MSEEQQHRDLGESLSAILICMSVASMCFTACYIYRMNADSHGGKCNWMITVLILLMISAVFRVVERFGYTETIFSPKNEFFGLLIGVEISVTWMTLLLAEFYTAMKYFQVSSQLPSVASGLKSFNEIDTKQQRAATTIGTIANLAVSIWPGILYSTTFYKKQHADLKSIFWEFEISIWLNALCRLVSLAIFSVAICRISACVRKMPQRTVTSGTMICLNWTLVILAASVQVSLIIFYSLGFLYEDKAVFHDYTTVTMYLNIVCTCASQIILSFIFSIMSEPIKVYTSPAKQGGGIMWEVRRDTLPVFRQQCNRPLYSGTS